MGRWRSEAEPLQHAIPYHKPRRGDRISVTPSDSFLLYQSVAGGALGFASFHHLPMVLPAFGLPLSASEGVRRHDIKNEKTFFSFCPVHDLHYLCKL